MPNYKDSNNQLHSLDSSEHEYLLPAGCVEISDDEAEAIRIAAITPPSADDIRARRDALLSACDWTQCRDVPDAVAAAWQPYRQALRDLSKQAGFPDSITWPVAP
jgi:hypothetical protein